MDAILAFLVTGIVAGMLAGLLGVGGGLVIVPALAHYFLQSQTGGAYWMHLAVGTSLAAIVVTGVSSTVAHHKHVAVDWNIVARLAPGLFAGAALGAVLAGRVSSAPLQSAFGLFEIAVAAQLLFGLQPGPHRSMPGPALSGLAGAGIGTISSLFGIGGGTLTVPFLLWGGVDIRRAVGSAAACGVPIALAGAGGFALVGLTQAGLPVGSTGYVYWPAFAGISVTSVLFAPVGAHLAHVLPVLLLRKIFAIFLALLGLKMLVG